MGRSKRGIDEDPRRKGIVGRRMAEKQIKQREKELNFDPSKIKRNAFGQQRLKDSNLPKGKTVGQVLLNKFDKKYYKWDGKRWIKARPN